MTNLTQLLDAAAAGDRDSTEAIFPVVYEELRRLAAAQMARESVGITLDATSLVNEAYLRLVGGGDSKRWESRGHFFTAAAEAMQRILIESARRRSSLKRGGNQKRVDLTIAIHPEQLPPDDLLDLDDALSQLMQEDPDKAKLVKLRFFGGLSVEEAAKCLGISRATADRYWLYARTWLFERLSAEKSENL